MVAFVCSSHAAILNAIIIKMEEIPNEPADLYLTEFFGGKFQKILSKLRDSKIFRAVYYMDNDFSRCTYKMISPLDLDYGVRGDRFKTLLSLLKEQGYQETVYDKIFAVVNCLLTRFVVHSSYAHNKNLKIYELIEGPNAFSRRTLVEDRLWGVGFLKSPGVLYNSYLDLTLTKRYDPILGNKLLRYKHGLSDPYIEKIHKEQKNPFIHWFGEYEDMPRMSDCSQKTIDLINTIYQFDPKENLLNKYPVIFLESYINFDRKTRKKILDLVLNMYTTVANAVGYEKLWIKGHPKNYFLYQEFMKQKAFFYDGTEVPLEIYFLNFKGNPSDLTILTISTSGLFIPWNNFGQEVRVIYLGDLFQHLGKDILHQISNVDRHYMFRLFYNIKHQFDEYVSQTGSKMVFAPQTIEELTERLNCVKGGMSHEV